MTSTGWWSQPFPPDGAITSEGIVRQLGTPPVDPLTVFVRESAQNSWDARLPGATVDYSLDIAYIPDSHLPEWRNLLLPSEPGDDALPLSRALRCERVRILAVSDTGTKGLGGPTRADVAVKNPRDWISFVLNVGEGRDVRGGGGTYGYGKAVFFRLSRVDTAIVYTRTIVAGVPTTRLIGAALGGSFDRDGRAYTGRHWWGRIEKDHVEPFIDDEAEQRARSLGLPAFGSDDTGTTIVVVDPEFGDFENDDEAARHLADTVSWQLWPLMLTERGAERLVPAVSCDGIDVPVPDPTTTYPLDMFVTAYLRGRSGEGESIECLRPRTTLGSLALCRRPVVARNVPTSVAAERAGVPLDPHHVCLLRMPELVVKYLECKKPATTDLAFAGVFRAENALDKVFADSEPPTHDDWVEEHMVGHAKTFVRLAKRRIDDATRDAGLVAQVRADDVALPLGAASNYLGGLLSVVGGEGGAWSALPIVGGAGQGSPGTAQPGADSSDSSGGSGGNSAPPVVRVRLDGPPEWVDHDGEVVLMQRVLVTPAGGSIRLTAAVNVRTADGSREDDPPIGAELPIVLGWRIEGAAVEPGADAVVSAGVEQADVFIRPPSDSVVEIDVRGVLVSGVS